MEDRRIDAIGQAAQRTAGRFAQDARDSASRAGSYMQDQMGRMSDRAQDWAADATNRIERLTGRPMEAWSRDARRFVQDHPLQAIAITIGLGFLLGKLLARD